MCFKVSWSGTYHDGQCFGGNSVTEPFISRLMNTIYFSFIKDQLLCLLVLIFKTSLFAGVTSVLNKPGLARHQVVAVQILSKN